jgi:hypothetical protein
VLRGIIMTILKAIFKKRRTEELTKLGVAPENAEVEADNDIEHDFSLIEKKNKKIKDRQKEERKLKNERIARTLKK